MTNPTYTFDENTVSDLHKDACGFRPGESFWVVWNSSSADEKQRIWDALLEDLDESLKHEREAQQDAIKAFECFVGVTMKTVQGSTREDAIRYLHDQYDTQGSDEWLEYQIGVPFGYLSGRQTGVM